MSYRREDLQGYKLAQMEHTLPTTKQDEMIAKSIATGLLPADSVEDKTIPCFARGDLPIYGGINTFMKMPYLEDVNQLKGTDVAFLGVPYDGAAHYRAGARLGPQGIRRASVAYTPYHFDYGIDLRESLNIVDIGDVCTLPSNNEKSFDQITKAVSHIVKNGALPMVMGGDHSITYPVIRGIAPYIDGNIGIIHFDCHSDMQDIDLDERMNTTPFYHATDIPNVPASNLVQIGISGPQVCRYPIQGAVKKNVAIMTVDEVVDMGVEKAAEIALDIAWKDAKAVYLSFDIDCMDSAYVPGCCSPEPGGFLPREVLKFMRLIAKEGLCGMDVVEVAPEYDVNDITSVLGARLLIDALASMTAAGKIGTLVTKE